MENKKLLNILQKDMNELEELIADIKEQGNFIALEIEFIHTKAKGVMQLVQLLNNSENSNGNHEIMLKNEKIEQLKETVSEIQEEVTETQPHFYRDESGPPEETEIKPVGNLQDDFADEIQNEVSAESLNDTVGSVSLKENHDTVEEDDEMLEEEEEFKQLGSTLGDSFLKGKSINDIITGQNKLEFKLSNRPVESIKTAIGINDRFQYIRELFDGSAEKFVVAVQTLDSKQNIKEAVDFLRQNYKWKKSETSLKFINLVKRRFQNE